VSTHAPRPPHPAASARPFTGAIPHPRRVPVAELVAARPDRWQERYAALVRASDRTLLVLAVAIGVLVTPRLGGPGGLLALGCAVVVALAVVAALGLTRSYEPRTLGSGSAEFRRVALAVGRSAVVVALAGLATQADWLVRPWVFAVLPAYAAAALVGRVLLRLGLRQRRRRGLCMLPVLAVGGPDAVRGLVERTRRDRQFGWTVVAACTPGGRYARTVLDGVPVVGDLDDAADAARRTGARVVAVTPAPGWGPRRLHELAWQLEGHRTELAVDPGLMETAGPRLHITPVDGMPLVRLSRPRLAGGGRLLKGVLDRLGALVLLVLTSPLLLAAALLVVADGGPVLSRHLRVGAGGEQFAMLRFRTTAQDGTTTAAGRLLLRAGLDGLPQLLTVLTGSMSLVGPRPLRPTEVRGRGSAAARRLLIRPGLTGLRHLHPAGAGDVALDETVRLVMRYLEGWSVGLDLAILGRTAAAALRRPARDLPEPAEAAEAARWAS
jgi:lipopolysaccharide/colanic/teichoic acid biosynthesis glycosyltransferase